MDWKRITSKRREKAKQKKAAAAKKAVPGRRGAVTKAGVGSEEDQNQLEKEEIRKFFVRLLPEINLRLFLEQEMAVFPQRLLWVEAITLTGFRAASCGKQKHSLRPRITRLWEHLTKNKNKKERR